MKVKRFLVKKDNYEPQMSANRSTDSGAMESQPSAKVLTTYI